MLRRRDSMATNNVSQLSQFHCGERNQRQSHKQQDVRNSQAAHAEQLTEPGDSDDQNLQAATCDNRSKQAIVAPKPHAKH